MREKIIQDIKTIDIIKQMETKAWRTGEVRGMVEEKEEGGTPNTSKSIYHLIIFFIISEWSMKFWIIK